MAIRKISVKLIILLLVSAVIPLGIFGGLAIRDVRKATIQSVVQGNINTARQAAGQITQYTNNALNILQSIAQNLNHADLKDWQIERILKNYAINFSEFNSLVMISKDGNPIASSELTEESKDYSENPGFKAALKGKRYLSPVFITDDLTPAMTVALPLSRLGSTNSVLIAELDLLNMWELVDQMTIGKKGYINIVVPDGQIIATGHPKLKEKVFKLSDFPDVDRLRGLTQSNPSYATLTNWLGEKNLVVGVKLPDPLDWLVSIEQPTKEAYSLATSMTYELTGLIGFFILLMTLIGLWSGRKQVVRPIRALIEGTKCVAKGDLSKKVELKTDDEFSSLAGSFNQMTDDLMALQENIRKQERLAVFGRIASGLAHDLKHPVQSIKNASRLMEKMHGDPEFRQTFQNTVNREFSKMDAFLTNLHNLTHDIPYNPIHLNLHSLLTETADSFSAEMSKHGVELHQEFCPDEVNVLADKFSISRVISNLLSNSIQAMNDGGKIYMRTRIEGGKEGQKPRVCVEVEDTGSGIPPERLPQIFEDFTTTKRSGRGLGLGLALSKRILDQHGAEVTVESEVGKGTTFRIYFQRS